MKIIHSHLKQGTVKVQVDNLNDLWYLNTVIDEGDILAGTTLRKIKMGGETDRNAAVVKKPVFLSIKVEKISLEGDALRANGIIIEGPEDVSRGSHHTFAIEEHTIVSIIKPVWHQFQLQRLKEATEDHGPKILLCVVDREEAYLAQLKHFGYQLLVKLTGEVAKKAGAGAGATESKKEFYGEVINAIKEYDERNKYDSIILASPAFWKEELAVRITDEKLKHKTVLATCSSVDETAFNEVIKRPEVMSVLKQDRVAKEIALAEKVLEEISKQGKVTYGFRDVKNAVAQGVVETVLVTEDFIRTAKEHKKYDEVDAVLRSAENMKATINLISSSHDGGKKIDGLGGIAALLRYKLEWNQ